MTARRIIKSLVNRGNAVLGVGCYSAAMACRSSNTKVIKVGTDMGDPWLDYYYEIIKPMQGNPFVPKVYSFYHDVASEYFVCNMERLAPSKSTALSSTDQKSVSLVMSAMRSWLKSEIEDEELAQVCINNPQVISEEEFPQLAEVLIAIRQFTDVASYDDCDDYPYDARRLDLHSGNIMLRNLTPIIIDPWCHNDMGEVTDLTEWAQEQSLSWDY